MLTGVAGHERELRSARTAYLGAVRRLDEALRAFSASRVPLDPGHAPEPRPWSRQHVQVMRELAAAFAEVIDRRRSWDGMRREWRPPH